MRGAGGGKAPTAPTSILAGRPRPVTGAELSRGAYRRAGRTRGDAWVAEGLGVLHSSPQLIVYITSIIRSDVKWLWRAESMAGCWVARALPVPGMLVAAGRTAGARMKKRRASSSELAPHQLAPSPLASAPISAPV